MSLSRNESCLPCQQDARTPHLPTKCHEHPYHSCAAEQDTPSLICSNPALQFWCFHTLKSQFCCLGKYTFLEQDAFLSLIHPIYLNDHQLFKIKYLHPGWMAHLVEASSHAAKGCGFNSPSEHTPRFQV